MPDLLVGQLYGFISPDTASPEFRVIGNNATGSGRGDNLMSGNRSVRFSLGAHYGPEPMSMHYAIVSFDSALLHGFGFSLARPRHCRLCWGTAPSGGATWPDTRAECAAPMRSVWTIGLTSAARHFIAKNLNRDGRRLLGPAVSFSRQSRIKETLHHANHLYKRTTPERLAQSLSARRLVHGLLLHGHPSNRLDV